MYTVFSYASLMKMGGIALIRGYRIKALLELSSTDHSRI